MSEHAIPGEINEVQLPDPSDGPDPRDIDGPADEHPLQPAHLEEKRELMKHSGRPGTVRPPVPNIAKLHERE